MSIRVAFLRVLDRRSQGPKVAKVDSRRQPIADSVPAKYETTQPGGTLCQEISVDWDMASCGACCIDAVLHFAVSDHPRNGVMMIFQASKDPIEMQHRSKHHHDVKDLM